MALDLSNLRKALTSLEKAITITSAASIKHQVNKDEEEVLRAGVIQNFEFTYEICWKFMKRWLEANINSSTIDGLSRKELFRIAAESQLIHNTEDWFFYHKARNEIAHTYNIETAQGVYLAALRFATDAKILLQVLESKND